MNDGLPPTQRSKPKRDKNNSVILDNGPSKNHMSYKGMIGDKGLVVKNAAAHHAISAQFEVPLDNTGKTLVVQ